MPEADQSTRRRILEAVVSSIEAFGIDQLTIRKIAKEAGANIASINYYFGTKSDLIDQALTMTADNMLEDVWASLDATGRPIGETLEEVFFYLLEGGRRYPNVTTAHMYRAVVNKDYDSPGGKAVRQAFDHAARHMVKAYPDRDPEQVRFVLSQVFAAIMFNLLAPNFFRVSDQFLPDDTERCRRLAHLYAGLLHNEAGPG